MENDIEAVRKAVDLRALAEAAGAKFTNNSSACPLHGGNNPRAFHVYRDATGVPRWRCFTGCQAGGDVIEFYKRWKHVDFVTAVRELGVGNIVPAGPPPPAVVEETRPAGPPPAKWQNETLVGVIRAQDILWQQNLVIEAIKHDRGLNERTIGLWMLGRNHESEWPRVPSGIVIPCWRDGHLWYVKVRRLTPGTPKYLSVTGGINTLFGTDHWQGHRTLIITEGEFDCMLAWQCLEDVADVVAVPGASTHLTMADLATLARYERIIAMYDNDKAGQAGAAYLQQAVGRVEVVPPPAGAKDIGDALARLGEQGLWSQLRQVVTGQAAVVVERYMLNQPEMGWRQVA